MLRMARPGETGREASIFGPVVVVCRRWNPKKSSADVGDERPDVTGSSASETWPLSSEAAKLLEISGSDTTA